MAQTENAMLILQAGGNEAGRRWPLGRKRIVIGRDIDCDVVLPDRLVSRHHAQIVWDTERLGYLLQDLYSKNGTFVNGLELAEPTVLQDGDEVQIALRFKLAFVDAGETAPLLFDVPVEPAATGILRIDDDTRQVLIQDQVMLPKVEGVCDKCGGELYQRSDDSPETVRNRLYVYYKQTSPLIGYYFAKDLTVFVDGNRSVDEVKQALMDGIQAALYEK